MCQGNGAAAAAADGGAPEYIQRECRNPVTHIAVVVRKTKAILRLIVSSSSSDEGIAAINMQKAYFSLYPQYSRLVLSF